MRGETPSENGKSDNGKYTPSQHSAALRMLTFGRLSLRRRNELRYFLQYLSISTPSHSLVATDILDDLGNTIRRAGKILVTLEGATKLECAAKANSDGADHEFVANYKGMTAVKRHAVELSHLGLAKVLDKDGVPFRGETNMMRLHPLRLNPQRAVVR